MVQHYTSNPLKAYTGQLDKPLVSIQYILRDEQHIGELVESSPMGTIYLRNMPCMVYFYVLPFVTNSCNWQLYLCVCACYFLTLRAICSTTLFCIVILKAENLLVLSDVEFMKAVSDYFTAIFDQSKVKQNTDKNATSSDIEETLTENNKHKLVKQDTVSGKKKSTSPIPKIKVNASIKNLRVALIENIDTPKPQALTLKVSCNKCISTVYSQSALLVYHF